MPHIQMYFEMAVGESASSEKSKASDLETGWGLWHYFDLKPSASSMFFSGSAYHIWSLRSLTFEYTILPATSAKHLR